MSLNGLLVLCDSVQLLLLIKTHSFSNTGWLFASKPIINPSKFPHEPIEAKRSQFGEGRCVPVPL